MIFEKIDTLVDSFRAGGSSVQEIQYTIDQYVHDKDIDIPKFFRNYINDGIEHKNGDRVEFSLIISDIFKQDWIYMKNYYLKLGMIDMKILLMLLANMGMLHQYQV